MVTSFEIQSILVRRKSKIFLSVPDRDPDVAYADGTVGAVIANISSLGYCLEPQLIEEMQYMSIDEMKEFYTQLLALVKDQVGYVRHRPMYPNFPTQVANASDEELWINAIMHYIGDAVGVRIMPVYNTETRLPFGDLTNMKWIGLATRGDIEQCYRSILEAKSSPSVQDKEDIKTFLKHGYVCAPTFTNKETMATWFGLLEHNTNSKSQNQAAFTVWTEQVKTATDVLRVVLARYDEDVSLSKNSKFGKMPRGYRKFILNKLESMDQASVGEDMMRHRNKWIRLGERLHAGEYAGQFPKIAETFRKIRNEGAPTHNSKVEGFLKKKDVYNAVKALVHRPGDFARRLNALLSLGVDQKEVVACFNAIAPKVSTPVLWQLYGFFDGRQYMTSFSTRLFLPKGKPVAIKSDNDLKDIPREVCKSICEAVTNALVEKYKEKNTIAGKKVFIDDICANLLIPTGNRSASTALRQVGRGSRFQIGDTKSTVRLFMYWKDMPEVKSGYDYRGGRVDLDLSAVMYDANWKFLGQCSYTNLREGRGSEAAMVHSGDITSAPNGASEFLDINLTKLPSNVAYIAANVNNFSGYKMNQLDVAFMGWMEREKPGSGEIYEPKSVQGRCDLTADATSTCPLILDVKNREIIWADIPMRLSGGGHRVENTMDIGTATADLASRMSYTRASLMDVFFTHMIAQGADVTVNREEADFVIAEDGDLSPFDVATIMAEWV